MLNKQISVQLLILKRQNCCREDLEEEQNGVEHVYLEQRAKRAQ